MSSVCTQIRRGAYYDSVTLMQLQKALLTLPGVLDAGVLMGTPANLAVLAQSELLTPEAQQARPEDLVIAVKANDEASAASALAQVNELLKRRPTASADEYRPRSLESATQMLPDAQWVLVSVPGRYATSVAREALRLGRHVFLYSDNVPLADEVALKHIAREKSLLVMGPDCGTALIGGVGLGFANRVRRGRIGIVGASGTGIQAVTARIHELGAGVSHAIGTGSHDLSDDVGALTTLQAITALARDESTHVIVLISKPPSSAVAQIVLRAARATGKPIVVDFIGYEPMWQRDGNLHFARTLSEAAEISQQLAVHSEPSSPFTVRHLLPTGRYLRGLYAGGTLAYEAQLMLRAYLDVVYSNAPLAPHDRLPITTQSIQHTIIDLGADEFMLGRLHPMIDNDLRIRRLRQEAADPETAIILMDVVLGYGAHPNPASELAPAIAEIRQRTNDEGRRIEIVVAVIGTDDDPQNRAAQMEQLRGAGARVESDHAAAVRYAGALARAIERQTRPAINLEHPFAAINVGLEMFAASLQAQAAPVVHVDWQPPAGGNEKLMVILERLKSK